MKKANKLSTIALISSIFCDYRKCFLWKNCFM